MIKGIFHCQLDQGYASRIENYPAGEMIKTDEKILSWSSRDQTDRTKAKDHYDIRTQLADIIHFERSALYCGLFQVNKNPLPYESFFLLRFAFYNEVI